MRKKIIFITIAAFITAQGCSLHQPSKPASKDSDSIHGSKPTPAEKDRSRAKASGSYTEKGYSQLKKGDTEAAISSLERAVSINPRDGKAYYHLADAWLQKKDLRLAAQYNKLALIHLKGDAKWSARAEKQRKRISVAKQ